MKVVWKDIITKIIVVKVAFLTLKNAILWMSICVKKAMLEIIVKMCARNAPKIKNNVSMAMLENLNLNIV